LSRPRVIYAHAPGLVKPEVLDFLAAEPLALEVREHEPEEGYYRLLAELWAQAQDFVLCEWDNLPYPGAIQEIWECEQGFCGKPYRLGGFYAACLGCTKVSREFMLRYPQALRLAGEGGRGWRELDSRLASALRHLGYQGDLNWGGWSFGWPHQHWPPIQHLHPYPAPLLLQPLDEASRASLPPGRPQWAAPNLQLSFGFTDQGGRVDLSAQGHPLPGAAFELWQWLQGRRLRVFNFWVPPQQGLHLGQVVCQVASAEVGPPSDLCLEARVHFPDGRRLASRRLLPPLLELGQRLPPLGGSGRVLEFGQMLPPDTLRGRFPWWSG
jgi:hypothetical protein